VKEKTTVKYVNEVNVRIYRKR